MPARRAASSRCGPSWPTSTTPPRPRAPSAATSPTCAATTRSSSWPRCASARWACSSASTSRTDGDRLNAQRLRLGHAHPARAPAQRDDAADAPARGARRVRARARASRPAPRPRGRGPRPCAIAGRAVPDGRPRHAASPTTTSGPRHEVDLPAFEIDRTPVTNGAYAEFVDDGGYDRPGAVDARGLGVAHGGRGASGRCTGPRTGASAASTGSSRSTRELPVMHVSWYEADAYARWRGRPPAHRGRVGEGGRWATEGRRYPWGDEPPTPERANLDQLAFGPARRRTRSTGATPAGATRAAGRLLGVDGQRLRRLPAASRRSPTPTTPRSSSARDYKVLRGGSWATRPSVARNTFRNWDLPERRQIFAGFRCARDRGER